VSDVDGWMSGERDHAELRERWRRPREEPQWRPGAMRPEERERLVRIGLRIVMGERAGRMFVRRMPNDHIEVGDEQHCFGFPPDVVLGDDPKIVLEHDVEWLVDELCETAVAWAERLPVCPIHPGAHALTVSVDDSRITASCPVAGQEIRSASY
jgi:hypothetical protein